MNEYDQLTRKIQNKELDILKEIAALCRKHNLSYYLYGGTLIGAVRHKGFIPWDDDMDILMPRKDYEQFLKIAREALPEHLFLQHYTTDKGYYLLFTKVRDNNSTFIERGTMHINMHKGIYVDIFPLDIVPDSKLIRRIVTFAMRFFCRMYNVKKFYYGNNLSFLKRIKLLVFRLIPLSAGTIEKISEAICLSCRNKNSVYLASLMHGPDSKNIYRKAWFEQTVKLEFENGLYDCPAGYDEYLRYYYGDYMQLPPVEKRTLTHSEFCDPEKQVEY